MIQLQVLNYILSTKDSSLITLNNLTDRYFSDYKNEFNFIKNHLDVYGVICDVVTFLNTFPNFEVIKVEETPDYLIKALFDDFNTLQLAKTFNDVRDLLMKNKVSDAMNIVKNIPEKLNSGVSMRCVDIIRDTSRYNDYVDKTQDFGKYYISTGFKELDAVIGGFDRQEELATIIARTNYGKSWILLKCATAAAEQGLNVGLYSGEMSEKKVGYRFDTLYGHMNNGAITHGNVQVMNEYKEYIDSLPDSIKGSLKVLTPTMINGPADVNALRAFIEKYNLDILFVDQLTLLEDQRKGKTLVDKMTNISKDLKNLQVMKKIPIISVSQQNRTATENETGVDTTQIGGADRIGQDSTVVIFILKKDDQMKLILGKSRDSSNGKTLTYNVDLNRGDFVYIPDEEDANNGQGMEEYENRYTDSSGNEVEPF